MHFYLCPKNHSWQSHYLKVVSCIQDNCLTPVPALWPHITTRVGKDGKDIPIRNGEKTEVIKHMPSKFWVWSQNFTIPCTNFLRKDICILCDIDYYHGLVISAIYRHRKVECHKFSRAYKWDYDIRNPLRRWKKSNKLYSKLILWLISINGIYIKR